MTLRGLMLDAARMVESVDYYRRFFDFCAEWEINAVVFRLTDDQGCALRFAGHPELVTHANALTPAEMRQLVAHAQGCGVTLIPEIESFGHTGYITGAPQYADLSDVEPDAPDWATGVIPLHPATMRLLADLYREVAALFPGPYLHGGCDEVSWGGSEYSRQIIAAGSRSRVWAEYLNALHALAQANGKELIVWGDLVLRAHPDVLDNMDRAIILHDWEYDATDAAAVADVARRALEKGFRIIGGPALIWCRWGPRAGAAQLRNIDAFADVYRTLDSPGALGVITTNWVPGRYLNRALWDGLAYAAVVMQDGSPAAREEVFSRFVAQHYGAEWSPVWEEAFRTLYNMAPCRHACAPEWMRPGLPVPWGSPEELRALLERSSAEELPFSRVQELLAACAAGIRAHMEDFQAFVLTVDYLAHLYWRERAARAAAASPDAATALLREIAERDRQLCNRLLAEWQTTHPPDTPPALPAEPEPESADHLVASFMRATAFSAWLAEEPARFDTLRKFLNNPIP